MIYNFHRLIRGAKQQVPLFLSLRNFSTESRGILSLQGKVAITRRCAENFQRERLLLGKYYFSQSSTNESNPIIRFSCSKNRKKVLYTYIHITSNFWPLFHRHTFLFTTLNFPVILLVHYLTRYKLSSYVIKIMNPSVWI